MISGISSSIGSMASSLFAKLDTKNQGYIEKSDLQAAFAKIADGSSEADEVFSSLDGDSDGKVTESELTSTLTRLAEQLDSQFDSMRMSQAMGGMGGPGGPGGAGGMPPPPPQDDAGFTEDELSAQLEEIGSSDSERASLISSVLENFDEADTDGDGKVSFKEAMAYDQAQQTGSESSSRSGELSEASQQEEFAVMLRMMQLAQSYGVFGQETEQASSVSSVA